MSHDDEVAFHVPLYTGKCSARVHRCWCRRLPCIRASAIHGTVPLAASHHAVLRDGVLTAREAAARRRCVAPRAVHGSPGAKAVVAQRRAVMVGLLGFTMGLGRVDDARATNNFGSGLEDEDSPLIQGDSIPPPPPCQHPTSHAPLSRTYHSDCGLRSQNPTAASYVWLLHPSEKTLLAAYAFSARGRLGG